MAYQTTILGAVVALVMFMAIMVTALGLADRLDEKSTPLLVSVFGAIASTVVALLALLRSDRGVELTHIANGDLRDIKTRVNHVEVLTEGEVLDPHLHAEQPNG